MRDKRLGGEDGTEYATHIRGDVSKYQSRLTAAMYN